MRITLVPFTFLLVAACLPLSLQLHEAKQITAREEPQRFLGMSFKPTCNFDRLETSCCTEVGIMNKKANTCLGLVVIPSQLKASAIMSFNDKVLMERNLGVGKHCLPLPPPFNLVTACLNIYHAEVQLTKQMFDACFQMTFGPFGIGDFGCVKYEKGSFSHNNDHKPE